VYLQGTLNGKPFTATANPWKDDQHVVTINGAMRKALGVENGDAVEVDCAISSTAPELPVDPDVEEALETHPEAKRAFEGMSRSHRKEHLQYINEAKKSETRRARIERMIETLQGGS
jgi:uncharacterized protein YdeI (YjbR/CyaY-like superfamily)